MKKTTKTTTEEFNEFMNSVTTKESLYRRQDTADTENCQASAVDLDRALQKVLNCQSVRFKN